MAVQPEGVKNFLSGIAGAIDWVNTYVTQAQIAVRQSTARILAGEGKLLDYLTTAFNVLIKSLMSSKGFADAIMSIKGHELIKQHAESIKRFAIAIKIDWGVFAHRAFSVLWPKYRELFVGVTNAAAGLSQSLADSIAYLPSLLMNAQTVYMQAAVVMGKDKEVAQLEFLADSAEWLQSVESRMTFFARNPGRLLDSIQNDLMKTRFEEEARDVRAARDVIIGHGDEILEQADDIFKLGGSVARLVADLPPEAFGALQLKVGKMQTEFDSTFGQMFEDTVVAIQDAMVPINNAINLAGAHAEANSQQLGRVTQIILDGISDADGFGNERWRELWQSIVTPGSQKMVDEAVRARLILTGLIGRIHEIFSPDSPVPIVEDDVEPARELSPIVIDVSLIGELFTGEGSGPDPELERLIDEV